MARPKLKTPEHSPAIRLLSRLYQALASMYLAVVLLLALAAVLAWATFVESAYGTEAVHFAIYDSWWFALILVLLGANVLCAALIRLPWRRHQTGFLITHAGILVLLAGCIYSAQSGIDAQMPVFEGSTTHLAYEDTRHFQLAVYPDHSPDGAFSAIDVPFAAGPFNWEMYDRLPVFPWRLGRRDRGVICNQDNIRLEVLDYQCQFRTGQAAPLRLQVAVSESGAGSLDESEPVELAIQGPASPHADPAMNLGARKVTRSGVRFTFWIAEDHAETEAFQLARPEGGLGRMGQIALYLRGQVFRFLVDELTPGQRLPLGATGYEAEFVQFNPQFLGAVLMIHPPRQQPRRMVLLAEVPEFNQQVADHGVYGSYWFDASSPLAGEVDAREQSLHNLKQPRVDIIQGADGQLHYRFWQSPKFTSGETLPIGRRTDLKLDSPSRSMRFYAESFQPHQRPGVRFEPQPFDPKAPPPLNGPLVLARLTVDGNTEQFWLEAQQSSAMKTPVTRAQRRAVVGKDRRVEITLLPDSFDVGFHVYLDRFQRTLDPGSSMASSYSSLVDFVTVKTDPKTGEDRVDQVIEDGVLITLNQPITRKDPATGRSFRIYQEAFRGPWKPGDPFYDEQLGGRLLPGEDMPRGELFLSWLTVNYDPGRGLKYFGSLMIVAGIATMFYMRAYFFATRARCAGPEREAA